MSTYVRFIGIDRHSHPLVRDLSGARRDAEALFALFADSVPGIDIARITDDQATVAGARRMLNESLGCAGPDDTVIVGFSGHGTRDHRLVTHDTDPTRLTDTTIPMAELADAFKSSRAKAVLCILDCCFSGGATARVLQDTPLARDPFLIPGGLLGKGRMLVTASHLDEPAYEHPTRRHGLLTDSLIRVLIELSEPTGIGAVMDQVLGRVRAEAAALGVQQTPLVSGVIEGGLSIPPLRAGVLYRAAFPEVGAVRVSAGISDLAAFGISTSILGTLSARFPNGLNALQQSAINDSRVLDGASLLVIAPTSAGKTFIGELAALRAVTEGRRGVFLLPYRALVDEKYEDFRALYGGALGLRVIRCTGDYSDQVGAFLNAKYDLALLTFESFLGLTLADEVALERIGLVVLDEAQFIADPERGITVELILTRLRAAARRGVAPQLLALSATIGQRNGFDDWLGLATLETTERPVPLEIGVMDRSGTYDYVAPNGDRGTRQLLSRFEITQRREKPSAQDVLVPLVRSMIAANPVDETVLIFRNTRGSTEGCANYLADELDLPPANETIAALPPDDPSTSSSELRRALRGGAAFHSADLSREERSVIERAFRDTASGVRILVATMTVAAGVNTPATTVVIVEHSFPWENRQYTVGDVRNMAGRAGRLGIRATGRAILFAETPIQRRHLFEHYVLGKLEPVISSFRSSELGTWVIRLLAQARQGVLAADVVTLLANTFGGYLAAKRSPQWSGEASRQIGAFMQRLSTLGLLEHEDGKVRLSLLGHACGRSSLAFETCLQLVETLRAAGTQALAAVELMALVQGLPEMDATYTPMFRKGQRETVWIGELSRRFGSHVGRLLQRRAMDNTTYCARAKRACILADWIEGTALEEIEKRYTTNPYQGVLGPGDVRRIADLTRYHLRSAYEIAVIAIPAMAPDPETVDRLQRRLELGIPDAALGLSALPLRLARGEYLALARAGVRSAADYWRLELDVRQALLRADVLRRLDALRPVTTG